MSTQRVPTGDVVEWLAQLHATHPTLSPIAVRILDIVAAAYLAGTSGVRMTLAQWAAKVGCEPRSVFRSLLDLESRRLITRRLTSPDPLEPVTLELNPQAKTKD